MEGKIQRKSTRVLSAFATHLTVKCCSPELVYVRYLDINLHMVALHHEIPRNSLPHWGRMMHKCVGNVTLIGSDNGLPPDRRQAIIWTNAGVSSTGSPWINFNQILIELFIQNFY